MAKHVRNTLFIIFLLFLCYKSHSQCTNVCIKGGSVAVTGTIASAGSVTIATPKGSYTVATTYSFVTVSGINNILTGALSVAVSNVGTNTALFNGTGLPPGATINISIPNATLPAYTYDCLTSSLIVLVNR
jgi:hypothetical protein